MCMHSLVAAEIVFLTMHEGSMLTAYHMMLSLGDISQLNSVLLEAF